MFTPQPYGQMMPGYGFRNPMYQQHAVAPQASALPQQMAIIPVTSMAQVDSAQVSFDGTPLFFYDTSADAVYVKQFNTANGTAPVAIYRREQQAQPPQYATVDMLNALARKVDELSGISGAYMPETEPSRPRRSARKEADPE